MFGDRWKRFAFLCHLTCNDTEAVTARPTLCFTDFFVCQISQAKEPPLASPLLCCFFFSFLGTPIDKPTAGTVANPVVCPYFSVLPAFCQSNEPSASALLCFAFCCIVWLAMTLPGGRNDQAYPLLCWFFILFWQICPAKELSVSPLFFATSFLGGHQWTSWPLEWLRNVAGIVICLFLVSPAFGWMEEPSEQTIHVGSPLFLLLCGLICNNTPSGRNNQASPLLCWFFFWFWQICQVKEEWRNCQLPLQVILVTMYLRRLVDPRHFLFNIFLLWFWTRYMLLNGYPVPDSSCTCPGLRPMACCQVHDIR